MTAQGNRIAQREIAEVFDVHVRFEWRGLGELPDSAIRLRKTYADLDAERRSPSRPCPPSTTRPLPDDAPPRSRRRRCCQGRTAPARGGRTALLDGLRHRVTRVFHHRIALSMGDAAREAGVAIVTGDTKVVERGKADGVFITTTGIGVVPAGLALASW